MGRVSAGTGVWAADLSKLIFFLFQAEDGIRYVTVTGVQTCALPISHRRGRDGSAPRAARRESAAAGGARVEAGARPCLGRDRDRTQARRARRNTCRDRRSAT